MTVDDIMNTSEPAQNLDVRRKRKWKEISHFFSMTRKPEYSHKSLEKALFIYGVDSPMSLNNFVMAVMHEYKFSNDLGMDNHLRFLYWSLEGGQEDAADWRELAACIKVRDELEWLELAQFLFKLYAIVVIQSVLTFYIISGSDVLSND